MITTLTLLLKLLFSLLSFFTAMRGFAQIRKFKFSKFNQVVFYISLLTYSFSLFYSCLIIEKTSLALVQGSFLTFMIQIFIKNIDAKNNKVLWRLPVIFALVAYNFDLIAVEIGFISLELVFLFLAFVNRETLNYVYRQQFKSAIAGFICLFSFYFDDIFFIFGLILILNMKNQIMNGLKLKLTFSEIKYDT